MERTKSITYTFSKRKAEDCDALRSESSSELTHEHLSTCFSSHTSSLSSLSFEAKPLIIDNISVYPLTKQSSKSLQQLISKSSPSELDKIICMLKSSISDLMIDLYGNYLCQTLFHTCSAEQRLFLLTAMKGSLVSIAMHSRGTHALQNLISMTNLKQEEEVYKDEFSKKIISLSKDLNASHVVQRLLSNISNPYFILREMLGNVKELALDKYGVCVIKKCCNDPQIMNEILGDCLLLMQHPYGNYAVQAILEI